MKLRYGTPEEAGMSAQRIDRIKESARGWVAQGQTPALVILAARRGVIVLHEAYGCLTPDANSPLVQRDTLFPLASLTKPITATAVMILVEDGLVGLNRPVREYIPEFVGEGKDAVMVHHLLTHTSGLNHEELLAHAEKKKGSVEIPPPESTQHPTIQEILYLRYDAPLWKPSGVEMSYCNYNYHLLGEIVRRVSGRSLHDFAVEKIFKPLGMKDTWYVVPESVKDRIVKRPANAPYLEYDTRELEELPAANNGVFSTALDMAVFGQMFLNRGAYGDERILSPATVHEMTRNQIPSISSRWFNEFFPEAGWGFGWGIQENKKNLNFGTLQSAQSFEHGGAGGVHLWIDPVREFVGVYFSVLLELWSSGRPKTVRDLFQNSVTAAIVEE